MTGIEQVTSMHHGAGAAHNTAYAAPQARDTKSSAQAQKLVTCLGYKPCKTRTGSTSNMCAPGLEVPRQLTFSGQHSVNFTELGG